MTTPTLPSPAEVWLRAWCARATVKTADPTECTEFAELCLADFDREWAPQTVNPNACRSQAAPDPAHMSVTLPVHHVEVDGVPHTTKTGVAARGQFLGREFLLIAGSEEALSLLWSKMMPGVLDPKETGLVSVRRLFDTAQTGLSAP